MLAIKKSQKHFYREDSIQYQYSFQNETSLLPATTQHVEAKAGFRTVDSSCATSTGQDLGQHHHADLLSG